MSQHAARKILVTGAGGGLGRSIAEHLARSGDQVIGTVRDPARAADLTASAQAAGLDLRFAALELTSDEALASLADELNAGGGVDVLVHNAGFGIFGAVEDVDGEAARRQFAVNLFGPLELTRLLLPGLRRRRGHIVWIGSLAGRFALPFQAHYSATKAAIAAFSDALRIELRPHGVRVSCVEPADFATGFTDARQVVRRPGSPYDEALKQCLAAVDEQERGGPGPEAVGRAVRKVSNAERPPARRPVGPGAGALCFLLRLVPDWARERGVAWRYRQGAAGARDRG